MTLNKKGFAHARELVRRGRAVRDDRDAWSEHQPTAEEENAYILEHGFEAFGAWHLGINEGAREESKGRYKFPYGDFTSVHRCAVISAESRAGRDRGVGRRRGAGRALRRQSPALGAHRPSDDAAAVAVADALSSPRPGRSTSCSSRALAGTPST
jgi:hypothetical protein